MPGMDGLTLLDRLSRFKPDLPVIVVTAYSDLENAVAAYEGGAFEYLPKPFDPEELLTIIDSSIRRREVLSGSSVEVEDLKQDLDEIKFLLLERGGGGVGGGWVEDTKVFLAPDEREVLELLCKGLMNKEIAAELFVSTRKIEQILTSIFRKTSTNNRTELVRWALSTGNVNL